MTREEATKELKLFKESAVPWDVPILLAAIDMAIEALQTQNTEEYAKGYNDAKREIALSGEYERAYQRGKADAIEALKDRPRGEWIE